MKKLIILSILLTTLSYGLNNKSNNDKKTEKNSVKKVRTSEQEVKEMVELWNKASSNGDFTVLENMRLQIKLNIISKLLQKITILKTKRNFLKRILFTGK